MNSYRIKLIQQQFGDVEPVTIMETHVDANIANLVFIGWQILVPNYELHLYRDNRLCGYRDHTTGRISWNAL